ncbi:MAG: cysteine hydrolase family protein [Clostridium sp.]|uniref:cysteine hydrolase family protein n=1 Tax=Clostridium sp. TaxID=1506 RepID=UPI003EE5326D
MKKLLVVVDYQKDFVDGSAGFSEAKELEEGIFKKINEYILDGQKVLCTLDTHDSEYLNTREGKSFNIIHCIKGTEGHKLYGKLSSLKKENIFFLEKKAFGISPESLCEIKKDFGHIDVIEIVGIVTNMCVISNAIMLQNAYINSEIIIDASLCASFDKEMHNKALDILEGIQFKVINR